MKLFGKIFTISLLIILIAELFSFCGYVFPIINTIGFFVVALLVLTATIYKLEYGLLFLLAELFIASKGYLFYLDFQGHSVSIRITIWLIVMAVWLSRVLFNAIKTKKVAFAFRQSSYFYYFLIFFAFIGLAAVNGIVKHNDLSNIFFDANGWFYLFLILPIYEVVFGTKNDDTINNILQVFSASVLWLAIKTLFFVYLFSHFQFDLIYPMYRWLRTTGVGEVTLIQGGFYRVFFQSHIYLLIYFVLFLLTVIKELPNKSWIKYLYFLFLTAILAVSIVNFSRSNWVGLIAGLSVLFVILVWQRQWQFLFKSIILTFSATIFGLILIVATVYFLIPKPIGGFSTTDLLSNRASEITGEAGASSRMALLPKILDQIKTAPILGRGFGATVTYKTSDPRILQNNPSGNYTTYAFEWGWLDIWLKFGAVGLLFYLFILGKIFVIDNYKMLARPNNLKNLKDHNNLTIISLSLGMLIIAAVSMFSPYTNHPLGLGYLVISTAIIEKLRNS